MKSAVFALSLVAGIAASAHILPLSYLHRQERIGNKICFSHHKHSSIGVGSSRYKAAGRAAAAWEFYTHVEYGREFSSIYNVEDYREKCTPVLAAWVCKVSAKPCRPAGRHHRH